MVGAGEGTGGVAGIRDLRAVPHPLLLQWRWHRSLDIGLMKPTMLWAMEKLNSCLTNYRVGNA